MESEGKANDHDQSADILPSSIIGSNHLDPVIFADYNLFNFHMIN